jgi:tight adherence protein B
VLLGPLWAVLTGVPLLPVPFLILSHAGNRRIDTLQAQLPDVLMILASSLRAGHSFLQALDSVAKEVDEPAATEFARTLAEIQLGRNVDDAMDALAQRVGSQDLEWAVTAINIQRKVGGNLAEVLETVANTIRQREAVRRQVRVLSAEGRFSVYILVALPFFILAYLSLVNPGYLAPLTTTPTGVLLLIAGALLMVVGFVWMRKIVRLDV